MIIRLIRDSSDAASVATKPSLVSSGNILTSRRRRRLVKPIGLDEKVFKKFLLFITFIWHFCTVHKNK